jgi:hypothetical protein
MMAGKAPGDLVGIMVIRKEIFDMGETGIRGGGEPVQEVMLLEHPGKIGGEGKHHETRLR